MPNPNPTERASGHLARAGLAVLLAWGQGKDAHAADALVVDATRTLVFSNAEDIALSGSGAAFSTAAPGTGLSPAAPANRRQEAASPVTFGLLLLQARISGPRDGLDVGNLGAALDEEVRVFHLAVSGGYRNVAVGVLAAGAYYRVDDSWLAVSEGHVSAAVSLLDGHLTVGAGPRLLAMRADSGVAHRDYLGTGVEAGVLVSNWHDAWNLAVTARSGVVAGPGRDAPENLAGVRLPPELIAGIGWSNSGNLADNEHGMPVRLMTDVVVDAPVRSAVALESVLTGQPVARGAWYTVSPRVGAEVDVWRDRLRLRGGAYLEPSRTALSGPRPHATAGFELRLFRLQAPLHGINLNLAWQIGVDYAPRYFHGAWLGINLWQQGQMGGQPDPGPLER